jgi:hypothetical protein
MALIKINTSSLADNSITTSKIADDAVENTKLDLSADYTFTGTIGGVGGGKVLQVQYYHNKTKTVATSSSNLWENINITPSATSSKILLICNFGFGSSNLNGGIKIQRGSSNIMPDLDSAYLGHPTTSQGAFATPDDSVGISGSNNVGEYSFSYMDSPNTTSQVSYRLRYVEASGTSGTIYFNRSSNDNGSQCISTVTLLEIEG